MRLPILLLLSSLALSAGTGAFADTVYKTVDEHGVVTFSDTPPADGSEAETVTIDTPQPQSPEEYQQNLEDMRETTDRMAADRREREKHRAELRELEARNTARQPRETEYVYDDYYPVYTRSSARRRHSYRPPLYPGYRPRPEHPIARPPLRYAPPSDNVNLGSNSQLMRPIVSPRR